MPRARRSQDELPNPGADEAPTSPPQPPLRSGFVEAGEYRLHHTSAGSGAPLVLVHGLGSAGYIEWRHNLTELARRRRVLAPDLPGFGRSAKPDIVYGVPLFADALEAYLDALRLSRVDLVGASLGGRVAIELALRQPERIRRLVLVNALGVGRAAPKPYYPLVAVPRLGEAVLGAIRLGLHRLPPGTLRSFSGRYAGRSLAAEGERFEEDYFADLRELHAAQGYHRAYLATVRSLARPQAFLGTDQTERLAKSAVSVGLLWGELDPLFPVQLARRAHSLLPGSSLRVIVGAGHTPQAERPAEFNQALIELLRG
ncbi:MAG: alpha/beta fold hydrolase [Candidatus Dormibacter sp.]|uniref:alpha/beta fold hydrolase n=1 Tax=Candidatus Dormibacter sp. TaxID=2973982 RepID=UPI000DB2BE90|nr:MAG: hypothetical protein DLM66_15080 [Candidatus Dormibacteraeota bacterium]